MNKKYFLVPFFRTALRIVVFFFFLFSGVLCFAQSNRVNTKYLSTVIPSDWEYVIDESYEPIGSIITFTPKNVDNTYTVIYIVYYHQTMNIMDYIDYEISNNTSNLLQGANIGAIVDYPIFGDDSKGFSFSNVLDEKQYDGEMYVFNKNGHSYTILALYKSGNASEATSVKSIIQQLNVKLVGKSSNSFDDFITILETQLKLVNLDLPQRTSDVTTLSSMVYKKDSNSIVFYLIIDDSAVRAYTDMDEETETMMIETLKDNLKKQIRTDTLLQQCLEYGINFSYYCYDSKGKALHSSTFDIDQLAL